MAASQSENETVCLNGDALGSLTFEWEEDRFRHHWLFEDSDLRLDSVESTSDVLWPLSPPLQQIHHQGFDDGRQVIFGVGMSGRGHWSASFTLVPELKCWIVELACKAPIEAERLLSSYVANKELRQDSASVYQLLETRVTLEPIAPSTSAKLELPHKLSFSPEAIASVDATSQWAFRLRVAL